MTVDTAQGPTVRTAWRGNRGVALLGLLLVAALIVLAAITGTGKSGELDPDAYDPSGAHALAALLHGQGIPVVRTTDLTSTLREASATTTTFVPLPQLLSDDELDGLRDLPGSLVFAGAGTRTLDALDLDAKTLDRGDTSVLKPDCDLPAAVRAGPATVGGISYAPGPSALGCYPRDGDPTVVSLPDRKVLLLGAADGLTNAQLGKQGNAALGLAVLGAGDKVVWLIPAPDRVLVGTRPVRDPDEFLADWVRAGVLQLIIAVVVLALWRARRLGRVVPEPLPVVVRASETVEGRGRLYQATRARDTASEALRSAALDQLSRRLHGGASPSRETLVSLVAECSGRSAAEVDALLYGRAPSDDTALVGLADALDTLIQEVARS